MNPHDPLRDTLRDYNVPVDKAKLWEQTSHAIPDRRRRRIIPLWWFGAIAGAGLVALGLIVLPTHDATRTTDHKQDEDAVHSGTPSPTDYTQAKSRSTRSANLTSRDASSQGSKPSSDTVADDLGITNISNINSTAINRKDGLTTSDEGADVRSGAASSRRQIWTSETGIADPVDVLAISGVDHDMAAPTVHLPSADLKFSKVRPAFYLAALQGIGFSGVSIEASTNTGQPEAERWQESFKSLEYLTTSLEGGIRLPKGWQAGLGMRYGRLTTAQTFEWTTTERVTGEGTSVVIIGEDGSTTSVTGDVSSTRRTTSEATRYNYHRTLDLDLLLAVPLWRRPGFALSGWLRGGFNLWYDVEGSVPDADWRPVPIDPASGPFTLATPFTWSAGLEARYQVSRHFAVHARASSDRLRYGLAGEGYDIRFNHQMTSFSLGVGYVR